MKRTGHTVKTLHRNSLSFWIIKLRKKLFAGFVLLCTLLASFNSAYSAAADTIFRDIQGHWAQTDISRALDAGYVKGYADASFRPDTPVKRSEFITMLNAAFKVPAAGTGSNFLDVHETDWFAQDIWSAVTAGYMDIYTDKTLNPNLPIPRQEAAALTANLAGFDPDAEIREFTDSESIAGWACKQINALVIAGIMDGYPDGSFRPDGKITRAEAVSLINRTLVYSESKKISALLKVTGSTVNIRSGPDTSYGILTKVYSGDMLKASLLSSNNWFKVNAGGKTGWIIGTYVNIEDMKDAGGNKTGQGSTAGQGNTAGTDNEAASQTGSGTNQAGASAGQDGNVSRGGDAGREPVTGSDTTGSAIQAGGTAPTVADPGTGIDGTGQAGKDNSNVPVAGTLPNGESRLIVIDAGHGGYDDGATGSSGVKEKDITLAIALKLSDILKGAGYSTLLTRSDDTYVSLPNRSLIANNSKANIFVSIHCNSSEYHNGHGTEVYTEPAVSNPVYKQQEESRNLAALVRSELIKALGLTDRGAKEKDLAVCRETNLPAILIETAFIDNKEEEQLLAEPSFQDKAAAAIKQGIDGYFSK